jgi:hypothetical protein
MAEDRPEDTVELPDSGRVKRAPPTIDLEATEVSDRPREAEAESQVAAEAAASTTEEPASEGPSAPPERESEQANPGSQTFESGTSASEQRPPQRPISPWVIAPFSGAAAAALVIGVGWMLGWPAVQPAAVQSAQVPKATEAAINQLSSRVASLEAKVNRPAVVAPDADAARLATVEKTVASLRDQLSGLQTQSGKLADQIGSAGPASSSAPASSDAAPAVDLSGINARLDQLERATRAASAAAAQDSAKAKADDTPLRLAVVATVLDLSVRQGESFKAALDSAKSLAPDSGLLKPLDGFAASGVPTSAALSRELLTIIPKLSKPAKENETPDGSLVDRLKAGASSLVRIERTDGVGNDRGAIVARATTAALHNDSDQAKRELSSLSPDDRAPAQAWIDKADARDAALSASHQFAADALAALSRPAQ